MASDKNTTKKPLLKSTEKAVIVTKTKVPASETLFSGKVKEMKQLLAKTKFMIR